MALPLALGVNLWIVAVALPLGLGAHARALEGASAFAVAVVSLAPLVALVVGVAQKRAPGQALALLVAFPVLIVAPQVLAAASLLAFLVAVAQAQTRAERQAEGPPAALRRLTQDVVPSRWRRRLRVYRGLTATAVLFPAALLTAVDLTPSFSASLEASFGAQAARAQALATVAVGLLWIVLLRAYVLQPLHGHLQHDRDLLAALEADRRHARRGRPRPAFYLAVFVALAAMAAVVLQRSR